MVNIAAYPVPRGVALWNVGDGTVEAEATKSFDYVDIKVRRNTHGTHTYTYIHIHNVMQRPTLACMYM
jgi:hypothetical protein